MKDDDDASVLISGGGPTGLALAIELGLRGIHCIVVEPRVEINRLRPRAKTLNNRTMEHFRRWGIAERIRATAPLPTSWSQDIAFRTSFIGAEITRITDVLGLSDDGVSPELGQQMPQYLLEEVLREVVSEIDSVDLLLGSRVTALKSQPGDVEVTVLGPCEETSLLQAAFVVGADGARSVVREQMGARYIGAQALRPNTGVVFRSKELAGMCPHPPAVQTWIVNEETPGMMGPIDLHGLWWLIAFGVDGTSPELDPGRLIDGAVGRHLPADVVSTDPWTARMELVDRCREGRIFLIGDASHLNPPFGGHGLNTGIGDAVDLGWKLAGTISGWAGPKVLDSYAIERRPLHRRVIDEAAENMATLAPELLSRDLDRSDSIGDVARKRASERVHATKTREFQSYDLVLGHRYGTSPILAQDHHDGSWRTSALCGARLPHCWIRSGYSTLDFVDDGYALLTGPGVEVGQILARAATSNFPLKLIRVAQKVIRDMGADWILIRPDQVVSARGNGEPDARLLDVIAGDEWTLSEIHPG